MVELREEQRESWGTRGGFILAAIGSAVGLGNLWGFPYKLYSYGGGAFLIPYIIALLVVGIPMMILEFSLGHYTQLAAPDAFKQGHRRFEMVGWWGIILAFVIVTYYPVILAYCFSFLWYSIKGIFNGGILPWAGEGIEGVANANNFFFKTYLAHHQGPALGAIRWNIIWPLIITWVAMYFCIFKGVKLVGKIVWLTVPLPWLMLFILAVRGLTLEGSMQGLAYYLEPVWSELSKPGTWRMAFGQVFFSLSLAFGVMITYASFLHRKSDLNNNAAIICLADFGTSFVAGFAVFATLGGMAFATQQAGHPVMVETVARGGPSLAFVAFPYALAQLPYSAWFSFVFFFALITLGIDSAFSISESVLASIVDKTGWRRSIVLPLMSVVGFLLGLFYVTEGGLNWLGTVDEFVNGPRGIAFMGLLECIVIGWLWRIQTLRRHANSRSDWQLGKWWDYLIRIVIPIVLGTLFFWQLFDDIGGGGFFRDSEGKWIVASCVGMGIMVAAPVLAIILSLVKGQYADEERSGLSGLEVGGKAGGRLAFILSIVSAFLLLICLKSGDLSAGARTGLLFSLCGGIAAIVISNYLVDKHNTHTSEVSWFARWAGVIGAMDVSAFVAVVLIELTRTKPAVEKAVMPIRHSLGGVSYIILTVAFLIIIGGLGWCFYRALSAAGKITEEQAPGEVGDGSQ